MRSAYGKWLLTAVLAAALLAGCAGNQRETTPSSPDIHADTFYSAGKSAVEASGNLVLDYTLEETRKVGDNTFTKSVAGKASYEGYAREGMTALVEETLDFGYYRCSYGQAYYKGKAYAAVNDSRFWTNQSMEDFTARQLPPVLLTPALYDAVTYGEEPGTVLFSQPRAMEAWVGEGQLLEASGKAVLTGEGQLLQTTYQVRYQKGLAEYALEVTVRVTVPEQLDLSSVRQRGQNGPWLSDLDAPRYLLQVVADVYTAQGVKCELAETITSEAIPLSYRRSSQVLLKGRQETLDAQVLNTSELSNDRGMNSESSQTEQFQNGFYTVSVDGSDPARNGSVTADSMRQYCEDTILSGLLAVKYLRAASTRVEGNLLHLELGGDLSFRAVMTQHLTDVLQVDLDALAQTAEHHRSGGYLTVDTDTGLPVNMGMFLEKSHTVGGISYRLEYRLEETLIFIEE
ncbi:MAG: hypothetical protein IJA45_04405 [Oscillospiraceae bacterium]|nr:hypothetical protein [Oscillospiraceae bacterium]